MTEIKLKITKAGIEACLKAKLNNSKVNLSDIRFSSDRFTSTTNDLRLELGNIIAEATIATASKSIENSSLRFFSVVNAPQDLSVGSVGLFDEDGVLFAVASVSSGELHRLPQNFSVVLSFGLTVPVVLLENIDFIEDQPNAIAYRGMIQHEEHSDPHPQYATDISDQQAQLALILQHLGELQDKVDSLEGRTGGVVSAEGYEFYTRDFNQQTTAYPTVVFYETTFFHLNKASVQISPNGLVRQTMRMTVYGLDLHTFILLPVSISVENIISIIGSPWQSAVNNDVSFRVQFIFDTEYQGKTHTCVCVRGDMVSPSTDFPINGHIDLFMEVVGIRTDLAGYTGLNSYPYPLN